MGNVNTNTKAYSDAEKTILKAVGWGWEDLEYTLEDLRIDTKLETQVIEKILESLMEKGVVRKKEGYIFDYKIFNFNDKELRSIDSLRWDAMKDRICP
jgi:predicted transcriptional regulator